MTEINKQFGFYGTIHCAFNEKDTNIIWDTIVKRLDGLYKNRTEAEVIEMLNSKAGRHFADELLDSPEPKSLGLIMIKIAMLNKVKMADHWAAFHDYVPVLVPINEHKLYKSALQAEMKKKAARELMAEILDCKTDPVWTDPNIWLNSEFTTARELKIMWGYIQEKLNKENTNGNDNNVRRKTAAC